MSASVLPIPGSGGGTTPPPTGPTVAAAAPAPAPAPVEKYRFDAHFQLKIASLVVRDNVFMQRTDGLILPEYFEDPAEAGLVSIACRYYQKYKKVPDSVVYATLIREDIANKVVRPEMGRLMVGKLVELRKTDISDRDYVVDQVATFARHQAVAAAMEQAIHKLDKKDFESIASVMQKALNVGAHVDINTFDFAELIERRTGERLDRAAGKRPPTGITTGYVAIDDILYHKGWGRRELSVLMGGAKAGKTTALIDFGINAWAAGYTVAYLTLEVSGAIISERMDANISEHNIKELHDHVHDVRAKVKDFVTKANTAAGAAGAKFLIQEFPTGSLRVSDVRRLIERWKAKGTKVDLLIIDYADLMAPERHTDNAIENSKSVYVNLRGLAMMEDLAILTATQTNRDGFKAAVARAEHVSEDFNKVRIADIIISINRTDEERGMNQARLYFAACRNQEAGFTIRIEQAPNRMKFISKVMGFE